MYRVLDVEPPVVCFRVFCSHQSFSLEEDCDVMGLQSAATPLDATKANVTIELN